ncbi:MAG: toast rack family protein [Anaerolineales bacterium]|nr:toast rack family protein [Anaerolineales bacterium]
MYRKLTLFVAILALASMACGFNVNVPERAKPGPEVTEDILVSYPKEENIHLKLSFGAGEMTLAPGADEMVAGTATYNYEQFKPEIVTNDGDVNIKMGERNINFFPSYNDLKNEWDFKLGSQPMDLTIESGAYTGDFEFGGLALTNLTVKDGAADVDLSFSELNQTEMSIFSYATGASDVKLRGLANANFSIFDFSAGAGDYTLDFSGDLQRDASIKIEVGLSNVIIIVPDGVDAIVTVQSGASNISAGSGWSRSGSVYKQKGEGPTLTFVIEMGAGNLTLTR